MKNKGFTLVELLVVIAILGVISLLSIPIIRNVQTRQLNKKYDMYLENVISGGKLYTDSYSDDLFGHKPSACNYIKYDDLKEKNLIKDIDIADVSCDTDYTLVKVLRYRDQYFYRGYIGCGPGNKDIKANVFRPEKIELENICNAESPLLIEFSTNIDTDKFNSNQFQSRNNIKVILSSPTGISKEPWPDIDYAFVAEGEEGYENPIPSWRKLDIDYIPPSSEQEKKITSLESVRVASRTISTPQNYTGNVFLVLRVNALYDTEGSNWNIDSADNYVKIRPAFTVDNTGPTFNSNADNWLVSKSTVYNSKEPKLNLDLKDEFSSESEIKYCYSYDSEAKCPIPTSKDDKESLNKYTPYKGNEKNDLRAISNKYDSSEHTVYLTIIDNALNVTKAEKKYKVSQEYNLTLNANTGTACASSPITKIQNEKWGSLCTPTKSGYSFKEWNTKADGTGEKITSTTTVNGNVTAYAIWNINTYTVSYAGGGATSGSTEASTCTYGQAITPRTNGFVRTGHTFNGWSGQPATCTGNVTLTATWKANTYTVSYAGGGATSGSTKASTCTYGQAISASANGFKKNYYHFNGWSGLGTCTGNKTLTATWAPNKAIIRYHTGTGSGSTLKTKPSGWSIKNKFQIWNSTTQDIQSVNYGAKADPINYHGSYLYINKSSKTAGTAVSGKEWKKCDGSGCAQTYYNQNTEYAANSYCNTINGNCYCCIKVNWK